MRRLNFQLEQRRREKLLATLPGAKRGYEYNDWELRLLEPAKSRGLREDLARGRRVHARDGHALLLHEPAQPSRARHRSGRAMRRSSRLFASAGHPVLRHARRLRRGLSRREAALERSRLGHQSRQRASRRGVDAILRARGGRPVGALLRVRARPARRAPNRTAAPEINDWMPAKLAVRAERDRADPLRVPQRRRRRCCACRSSRATSSCICRDAQQSPRDPPRRSRPRERADPSDAGEPGGRHRLRRSDERAAAERQRRSNWELPAATGQLVNTVRVVADFARRRPLADARSRRRAP